MPLVSVNPDRLAPSVRYAHRGPITWLSCPPGGGGLITWSPRIIVNCGPLTLSSATGLFTRTRLSESPRVPPSPRDVHPIGDQDSVTCRRRIHRILDARGCRGPIGVGRRRVQAGR